MGVDFEHALPKPYFATKGIIINGFIILICNICTKVFHINRETFFSIFQINGSVNSEFAPSPGELILRSLDKYHGTAVVMGTRGFGIVRRTILGSVSQYVITHSHVPVTVVPPEVQGRFFWWLKIFKFPPFFQTIFQTTFCCTLLQGYVISTYVYLPLYTLPSNTNSVHSRICGKTNLYYMMNIIYHFVFLCLLSGKVTCVSVIVFHLLYNY